MQTGRPNPLLDIFKERSMGQLLDKCFKRSEAVYEKLKADVDRADNRVLESTVVGFEAGIMLDNLRRAASLTPLVVVHGEDDPVMPAPSEDIWNYLTIGKEEVLVPITIPGVRHFPMLEHEPFPRLAGDFLEATDISKLEIRERWRRRSR
jgi:pimeloyl-ACP methyl ester carboxylesterase